MFGLECRPPGSATDDKCVEPGPSSALSPLGSLGAFPASSVVWPNHRATLTNISVLYSGFQSAHCCFSTATIIRTVSRVQSGMTQAKSKVRPSFAHVFAVPLPTAEVWAIESSGMAMYSAALVFRDH